MRALSVAGGPRDPAPSLWRYRLARLWRRRWMRRLATVQAPALALAGAAALLAADPAVHAAVGERVAAMRAALDARPEFAVRALEIEGASPPLAAEIERSLPDAIGASSLALDVAALRRRIDALGAVAAAEVALEAPETLRVRVAERAPAALWRREGRLVAIDEEGVEVGDPPAEPDALPLLAGEGAGGAVREARALAAAAAPLGERMLGLVRVGQRRWDVALTRDLTIMLPAEAPIEALRAALALHEETGALDRDLRALDMRLPDRPTLRLSAEALERLTTNRALAANGGEDA